MQVLISPHPDDAVLFASYFILREKPLVITVTHPTYQGDNGNQRIVEDYSALRILGAPICFLGIDEDKLTLEILLERLHFLPPGTHYYIPEYEKDGNPQHNLINIAIKSETFNWTEYKTYSGLEDRTIGSEVIPTEEELLLKQAAMACYRTQIENPNTAHYFNTYAEYQ